MNLPERSHCKVPEWYTIAHRHCLAEGMAFRFLLALVDSLPHRTVIVHSIFHCLLI